MTENRSNENTGLYHFDLHCIRPEESEQAIAVEQNCFSPNEACTPKHMRERIEAAPELFLAAAERSSGKVAGILNGLATDEETFRDAFFTDVSLYRPEGKNIMILGLAVLPPYRRQGLARELMKSYASLAREQGRKRLILTCLDSRVPMYEKFGFADDGIAASSWGGEIWHQMSCRV